MACIKIEEGTYNLLSVTLTLFSWSVINFHPICSARAFHSSLCTLVFNFGGPRNASTRKGFTLAAVIRGGSNCIVSTGSRRGLCREMRSKAGFKYMLEG